MDKSEVTLDILVVFNWNVQSEVVLKSEVVRACVRACRSRASEVVLRPQAMLKATELIWTVLKLNNMTTLYGGGGTGRYFALKFENCPTIFGQDCSKVSPSLNKVNLDFR